MNKCYNIQYNLGTIKYVVNYHNGVKKHNDNSPFFDIKLFNNKRKLNNFIKQLQNDNYKVN